MSRPGRLCAGTPVIAHGTVVCLNDIVQCLIAVVTNHYQFSGLNDTGLLPAPEARVQRGSRWAEIKVEAGLRSFLEAPEETLPVSRGCPLLGA